VCGGSLITLDKNQESGQEDFRSNLSEDQRVLIASQQLHFWA